MSAADVRIARARGEADAAKARLMATVDEAKARLAPGTLASNAVQTAKDRSIVIADEAVSAVKERPGVTAGIATVTALYIARKPLFSAVRSFFSGPDPDNDTNDNASRRTRDDLEKHNG